MTFAGVEIALDAKAHLAESPVWDEEAGVLWWVDIFRAEVHRFAPELNRDETFLLDGHGPVGSLALRGKGGLLVALGDGLYTYAPGGAPTLLASPEPERAENHFNDGRTDRQGRFWVGSRNLLEAEPSGTFYRLDADGSCTAQASGIFAANGTAFSPDGRTGYHADSLAATVWRFDCDPESGALANRAPFVQLDRRLNAPDGATVDADGCYWLAHALGWRIIRYTPEGWVDRIVHLPVAIPTSVTFGGRDLQTLFITTARYSLSPEELSIQPLAGSILALNVGVSGVPETKFAG